MRRVLEYLAEKADEAPVSGEDVAAATGIGDGAMPLLADLVRRGWLVHEYELRGDDRRLCYRLTPAGRDALATRGT